MREKQSISANRHTNSVQTKRANIILGLLVCLAGFLFVWAYQVQPIVFVDWRAWFAQADVPDGFSPVVKAIDGDTIDVREDGMVERVRLLGVNTPETVDPRRPVQCFGREAKEKTAELVAGKSVKLEPDPLQANRDKYQRLLRYVYLPDGRMLNQVLVEEGYAFEYTYQSQMYSHQADFKAAQAAARAAGRGLWSTATCSGQY